MLFWLIIVHTQCTTFILYHDEARTACENLTKKGINKCKYYMMIRKKQKQEKMWMQKSHKIRKPSKQHTTHTIVLEIICVEQEAEVRNMERKERKVYLKRWPSKMWIIEKWSQFACGARTGKKENKIKQRSRILLMNITNNNMQCSVWTPLRRKRQQQQQQC